MAVSLTGNFAMAETKSTDAKNADVKSTDASSIKKGQKLAQKLCASCHNIEKSGKSPEKLAPPFRTFASKWPLESLEEALAEGIVVGHSIMPEFEFKTDDITAMLDFMADLAKK